MGEHSTWFHLLPFYENLQTWASHYLERKAGTDIFATHFSIAHVVISALVALILIVMAIGYRRRISSDNEERLLPDRKFGVRNIFELVIEAALSIAEGVMGRRNAEKYFPLIGALVFFILFNNLIGLVPGFLPATDTLKTNFALSFLVFFITHIAGLRAHGLSYLKHFAGPIPLLAPLMIPIEIFSHIARPFSLALRLLGNMAADHKVLSIFFFLVPVLLPLPFYILGILVCIVQTLVFSLLSMVYIQMAVEHDH
ncbi:MAG: F0F1 ATP synthase subunit A [Deltaproteobacteria bacterium]|nr:F0F1 ATP synthase subunit A [Deltaproteobacteria bacterium]